MSVILLPMPVQSATDQLLSQGLLGVVVLGLLAALLYLQRQNERLRAQIDAEHAARLLDQRENTKVLLEAHDQVGESVEVLKDAVEVFQQIRRR